MWSYYGAKTNLIKYYPPPKYGKIIEPFAGTARYSLKYFDRDILLIDKYDVIIKIWKWLQSCSPNDILKLPRFKPGQAVNDFTFDCEEAKMFMGFIIGCGAERPRIKGADRKIINRPNHVNYNLKRVASELFKIKHWKILKADYTIIPNQKATWFIDPPYQYGGEAYVMGNKKINYPLLAEWCMERKGQVIVCENTKATWMNFNPIIKQRGSVHKTIEGIWSNISTNYDNIQQIIKF
jgi:hypothetical protein